MMRRNRHLLVCAQQARSDWMNSGNKVGSKLTSSMAPLATSAIVGFRLDSPSAFLKPPRSLVHTKVRPLPDRTCQDFAAIRGFRPFG